MNATLEIDENLLKLAEQAARNRGKSVAALVEEALRLVVPPPSAPETDANGSLAVGLEDNDPFFSALEEIRAHGRVPAAHREIHLP